MKTHLVKTLAVFAALATAAPTVMLAQNAIAAPFNADNLTDFGAPDSTAGGGTRGCFAPSNTETNAGKSLTLLTPHNLKLANNEEVMPLTVQSHPEFFWYVPEETKAQSVEFILSDEKDNPIYQAELAVPATAGIMSVSLPQEEEYALKEGMRYHWVVSLVCDRGSALASAGNIFVDGYIQRLDANSELAQQVAQSPDADDYAKAGIWQEALASFAHQRRDRPQDVAIAQDWQEFLESVNLGQFADVEFVSSHPLNPMTSESLPQ
ncbi:DUF928 domain-containing protein [Spirulina sp. 06S082]|uniref:DUF928 domain-containing protein n=1 Tax=Spirulina sp. 06S082 TaxID=3110248 RepID=UPI002B1E9FDA|nr:DUF928 domain-containing protein [Spirulina sp. 06S082]MEA5470349.1 DUF928 domain-containing protein [Spirulina sp. 06S082]